MTDEWQKELGPLLHVIISAQILTIALVLHLWFDMMGHFDSGAMLAALLIIAGLLFMVTPDIYKAYRRLTDPEVHR